jgi:hypothetical protein
MVVPSFQTTSKRLTVRDLLDYRFEPNKTPYWGMNRMQIQ